MGVTGEVMVPLDRARAMLDPRAFELIILPTEYCNFRCTYCYEDFKIGAMDTTVVESLKNLMRLRAEELDLLAISWFGGEPLLAASTVLNLSTFARDLMRGNGKAFRSGMTTNGYTLTPALFMQLLDAGVNRYQISLDGPRELHNRSRRRADGHGTFDRIWSNLLEIARIAKSVNPPPDFHVVLRVHYDANTADKLEPLVEAVSRDLGLGRYFSLHMHEIERLGGPHDDAIAPPSDADHEAVRRLMSKYGQGADGPVHTLAVDVGSYICYAARANSLLIRADGRIGKCTVALDDERNVVGRLKPDGTLDVYNERLKPWIRGVFSGESEALACPRAGMPESELVQIRRR